jgi:hypothetical protein
MNSIIVLNQVFDLTMNMDISVFQVLFGCAHDKTTFPLTPIKRGRIAESSNVEPANKTYVVCLDCGKELAYDWDTMRKISSSRFSRPIQAFRRIAFGFRLRSAS